MVLTVLFAKDGGYIYVQKVYQPAFKPDDPAGRRMGAGGGERGRWSFFSVTLLPAFLKI